MPAKINGTSIEPITAAFLDGATQLTCPANGIFYALEPYGGAPVEGPPEYDEILVSYPGLDGVGRKRLGFRARKIHFDLMIVDESASLCSVAARTLFDLITLLPRFTVSIEDNGGTSLDREGCILLRGTGTPSKWFTIGNKVILFLSLDFVQLSVSN